MHRIPPAILGVLLSCGLSAIGVERASARPQDHALQTADNRNSKAPIPGTVFHVPALWEYSAPLIAPEARITNPSAAQKDPTVVFHEGKWHVFMTVKLPGKSAIEYCAFANWEEADQSARTLLNVSESHYYCAPQVFYFRPHQKWYLIFQMDGSNPEKMWVAYSTTRDIADPRSWTRAQPILDGGKDDPRTVGGLDYWIICDHQRAYLFLTSLDGRMWRLWTRLEDFPRGFGHCELALQGRFFEASHTYKLKGIDKYLTLIEENGRRYYQAYQADRLDGEWLPIADSAERPFAGWNNIRPAAGVDPWTDNVSHGELIRDGADETLTVDPDRLRFVFQGMWDKHKSGKQYGQFQWRVGMLSPVSTEASAFPAGTLDHRARHALFNATAYLRSLSTEGGFLWRYSVDLKHRAGENLATASQVWIQPPGTPLVGMAFLRAYEATHDECHLDAARAAAFALAHGQLESGGWDYLIEFEPEARKKWYRRADIGTLSAQEISKRRNVSTYDDDNTQSALRFLLAYCRTVKASNDPRDHLIRDALAYGLNKMLEAQYPIGAWPQRYDGRPKRPDNFPVKPASYPKNETPTWPDTDYKNHYTFNDNTHRDCIRTMLEAYHHTGEGRFMDAAKRGGDFIILAQMPEPQPVWAQQYNAQMEPAWARAFEPPCVTGAESVGVLRMLMDLYLETGEQKYLKPIPPAFAWYERSAIAPNRWARYYELRTNRQIFGDRDGKIHYRLEDISAERQRGYSWSGDYGVRHMMAYYEKLQKQGRDALLEERNLSFANPSVARGKALEPRIREILAAQDHQGRWITPGKSQREDWQAGPCVEMAVFIENIEALARYLSNHNPSRLGDDR